VNIGQNKLALKQYRKNILPPFDDERWQTNTGFNPVDLFKEGYNISFTAPQYQGVNIYLPDFLAGNKLSLSAEYADGISPWIEIIYQPAGGANPVYRGVNATTTKIENYAIPLGATGIRVKVSSTAIGTNLVAFRNLQLEIGEKCTEFEEMYETNETSKKGLSFDGRGAVTIDNMNDFLSAERDFSMEVIFTPRLTSRKSNEEFLMGWSGWHEGLLYNSNEEQVRMQIQFKNKSTGTVFREVIQSPAPFGKRSIATMVYRATDRQLSLFVDGVLKQRVITSYADKAVYDFLPFSTGLSMGAISNLTYGFTGTIERGRLWDRVLSDAEVKSGTEANLKLEYDFTKQDVASLNPKDSIKQNSATIKGAIYLQKNSEKSLRKNLMPKNEHIAEFDETLQMGNQTASLVYKNIEVKPNTTYTLSLVHGDPSVFGSFAIITQKRTTTGATHNGVYGDIVNTSNGRQLAGSGKSVLTFTTTSDEKYITVTTGNYTPMPTKVVYSKIQLELGSIATEFESYKFLNRLRKSVIPKASFKEYPFNFVRGSALTTDSKVFGTNQPKITSEGIYVGDASKNLFSTNLLDRDIWNLGGEKSTVVKMKDITPPIEGLDVYKTHLESSSSTPYINSQKHVSVSNVAHTISFWVYPLTHNYIRTGLRGGAGTAIDKKFENLQLNAWNRIEYTANAVTTINPIIYTENILNSEFYLAGVQVETKNYATPPVIGERRKENLAITDAGRYIDTERGSIEMEIIPLGGETVQLGGENWGQHDLSCYLAGVGGFIIRRSYSKANRVEFVIISPVSGINLIGYRDDVAWKNGDTIKYRMDWNKANNKTVLAVNDSKIIDVGSMMKTFESTYRYSLNVGSRGVAEDSYGCGNAIYKSLIIRNRNGETVYKL